MEFQIFDFSKVENWKFLREFKEKMIISVNWLKKFVPNLPEIGELSKLIGARLVEIEGVEKFR